MNMILLTKDDITANGKSANISGRRFNHIRDILKAKAGDRLCVGLEGGRIGTGRIVTIAEESAGLDLAFEKDPPAPIGVDIVLALPRPIMLRRIISHLTSIGVKRVMLIGSARVEKSYWKSPALSKEAMREQIVLGLEQAKDTIAPSVSIHPGFNKFIREEFPAAVKGADAILLDPNADSSDFTSGKKRKVLVIGPEGGFLPSEIDAFKKAGCRLVNMGERILRVETAVIAATARAAVK